MTNMPQARTAFEADVAARFGILPNFFRSAQAAPELLEQLWGFAKVRYRGLAKNLARAQTMFALANLYQVRRQLLPIEARCAR